MKKSLLKKLKTTKKVKKEKKDFLVKKSIVAFDNFIANNPLVKYREEEGKKSFKYLWGDESVSISVPNSEQDFSNLSLRLQDIFLPPTFSALYHIQEKKIEFLYTVFPRSLGKEKSREFEFCYEKNVHRCYFGNTSENALKIAECFEPSDSRTPTNYRNLDQFHFYVNEISANPERTQRTMKPFSFWVENLSYEFVQSEQMVLFAKHLNFYMLYFDQSSPVIDIKEEVPETTIKHNGSLFDVFPSRINGHQIDQTMLGLLSTAYWAENNFLKFLYYFHVIEYAAFYFRSEEVDQRLRRILLAPQNTISIESSIKELMDISAEVYGANQNDDQKINTLIGYYSDLEILWKIISFHKDYFSNEIVFDGGCRIDALIKPDWSQDDVKMVLKELAPKLIKIRNFIAHAREKRNSTSISPTERNANKLVPWIDIVQFLARQTAVARL